MRLRWTSPALRQLHALHAYIAADHPAAAERILTQIRGALQRITQLPHAGRAGRVAGTRELVIPGTNYLAAYRIHGDEVHVLAILHGAQHWPTQL